MHTEAEKLRIVQAGALQAPEDRPYRAWAINMTLTREAEVRRLNEADTHIADTERRITAQETLVERLRADGHDAVEATRLLANIEDGLGAIRQHRALIVDMIRRIDAGEV